MPLWKIGRALNDMEYIFFQLEIAELDCFWYKSEYCFKKFLNEENTGLSQKKTTNRFPNIPKFSKNLTIFYISPKNIWIFVERPIPRSPSG